MIENLTQLKDSLNIIEIIEHYLPLRKVGVNYQCLCPFHNEKTPSFIVNPNKNIFYCFGCGENGDSIKFVMLYKHLSFIEATQEVANMINFSLIFKDNTFALNFKNAAATLDKANSIFKQALYKPEHKKILQYLYNRGLSDELISKYDLGFCDQQSIQTLKRDFRSDLLTQSGLLKNDKCFLYNRITFAFRDDNYKVRGFSGRSHPYYNFKNAPKYINSTDNAIFKKSFLFYGGYLAKRHIAKKAQIIVCEGFFDTIAFHNKDYLNAVATIGTAFNKSHLSHIFKYHPDCEIIFCFDNDNAGASANIRALKLCYDNLYFNAKVLKIKGELKDLGETLEKPQHKITLSLQNGFSYFIAYHLANAKNDRDKDNLYKQFLQIINNAPPFSRATMTRILKKYIPSSQDSLPSNKVFISLANNTHTTDNAPRLRSTPYSLQNRILHTMLMDESFFYIAKSYLTQMDFTRPELYNQVMNKDFKALSYVLSTQVLQESEQYQALELFKKQALQRQIKQAIQNNDLTLSMQLKKAMYEIDLF